MWWEGKEEDLMILSKLDELAREVRSVVIKKDESVFSFLKRFILVRLIGWLISSFRKSILPDGLLNVHENAESTRMLVRTCIAQSTAEIGRANV